MTLTTYLWKAAEKEPKLNYTSYLPTRC